MKMSKLIVAALLFAPLPLRADDASDAPKPARVPDRASPSVSGTITVESNPQPGTGADPWTVRSTRGGLAGGGGFSGGFGEAGAGGFFDGNTFRVAGWASNDRPALITTQAMDAAAQSQWKEDLNVMDKLLRDQTAQIAGDFTPRAMGITLRFANSSSPMYVEGAGAIFSGSVSLPLAAGDGSGKKEEKPGDANSAWERAKLELDIASGRHIRVVAGRDADSIPKFNQTKLDSLIDGIVKVLPEANHIRSLKPDESVIVTITGTDDGGNPLRLTIKAKKSDIDDASGGKIKPEEFKQRVAQRIG